MNKMTIQILNGTVNGLFQPACYVVNLNDVLVLLSNQIINSMLIVSILFLILCVVINRTTWTWKTKSWKELLGTENRLKMNQDLGVKLIIDLSWVFLPIAIGFVVMLIAYKMKINI
jgi:hypothetical protein